MIVENCFTCNQKELNKPSWEKKPESNTCMILRCPDLAITWSKMKGNVKHFILQDDGSRVSVYLKDTLILDHQQ